MNDLKHIEFNGKCFDTKFYKEISDKEFSDIRNEHYRKPDFDDVVQQIKNVESGKNTTGLISRYYFQDLMEKTRKRKSKFSVEEVFSSKELVGFLYGKTQSNPRVYNSKSLVKNLETVCRIGGSGCVWSSASNFPINAVDMLIKKYNRNNAVYDFSCGWGNRMLGSVRNGMKYFGTDPNYILVDRLKLLANDYAQITGRDVDIDIRSHGSEILVPEWGGANRPRI